MRFKNYIKSLFILLLVITFGACKKTKDKPAEEFIGPITVSEFNSVTPPIFQNAIKAYETVTTANPQLLQNESNLARAIFDWIKTHPNGREQGIQSSFFTLLTRLTIEEFKLLILHPIKSYKAYKTVDPSAQTAMSSYPCDADVAYEDSKADALRHAYWNALMVRATDADFTTEFTTAHESGSTKPEATKMDLHNNKIGRDLALKYPNATNDQILTLLLEKEFYFLANANDAIPSGTEALVYFAARRPYDGKFQGSMTNPDSGGPWAATFYFNQCGNVIRGEFTINRTPNSQKRRFSGTISATGAVNLKISDPYSFENPSGLPFCTGMQANLNGNTNALSGNWSSSNCFLGGVITLSR